VKFLTKITNLSSPQQAIKLSVCGTSENYGLVKGKFNMYDNSIPRTMGIFIDSGKGKKILNCEFFNVLFVFPRDEKGPGR